MYFNFFYVFVYIIVIEKNQKKTHNCCALFDNKSVNLLSSFAGIEPTHSVTGYDQSQRKKVQVTQTDIVRVYN